MESNRKQVLKKQKDYFEQKLKDRLAFLSEKGIKPPQAGKDTIVRKFEATIRAVKRRLRTIADNEKRTEELAKMKADRAAAPKKGEEGGKGEKSKKAPDEGKGKKAKEGKKTASPKAQEGDKAQKKAEAPGKATATAKKPAEESEEKSGS